MPARSSSVGLGKNCLNERGDHLSLLARNVRKAVAERMDTAALPRPTSASSCGSMPEGLGEHPRCGVHTTECAVPQPGKKRGPEHGALGGFHADAEGLTAPSAVTPVAITTA